MKPVSRRSAMLAATAAVAAAGVSMPATASDAVLLTRIKALDQLYKAADQAAAKLWPEKQRIAALPGCPPWIVDGSLEATETLGEHPGTAFLRKHGWLALHDQAHELMTRTEEQATVVFQTPALTTEGAIAKLHVVYKVYGDRGLEFGDGAVYSRLGHLGRTAPWIQSVVADFERLAGEGVVS